MKANELRIGNWINLIELCNIEVTAKHIVLIDEGDTQYSPIPLTKKWLCYFEFNISQMNSGTHMGCKEVTFSNKFVDISIDYRGLFIYQEKTPITYVHELQNLYFALTGDELSIIKI